MILVDTSVWADHFRSRDDGLDALLRERSVLVHALVIGELALGHLRHRTRTLAQLHALPKPSFMTLEEALTSLEQLELVGSGFGWVDANLLIATHAHPNTQLWTRDRRLGVAAERLSIGYVAS